eukprot:TRINITY_DN82534_c0_g1_i1.p1 TRINITY_DN82534_c0_g1~~TRINITY_DN82534_c0_g1_i1.p1  ORF type:complete len:242 (+),score=76.32 TRINITY_DN82534_c0_g1_i1:80-727(+)
MASQPRLGGTNRGASVEDAAKARQAARAANRAAAEAEGVRAVASMAARSKGPLPNGTADLKTETTGHLLATLQMTLRELDEEVKAEEQGAEELRRHLQKLQNEHNELRKERDRAAQLVEGFEMGAQSFEKEYARLMENSDSTYKMVRKKHGEAIGILSKDETFAYHPAFKRHTDQFEAAYFTPIPLKKAEEKKSAAQQKIERMKKTGALAQTSSS